MKAIAAALALTALVWILGSKPHRNDDDQITGAGGSA